MNATTYMFGMEVTKSATARAEHRRLNTMLRCKVGIHHTSQNSSKGFQCLTVVKPHVVPQNCNHAVTPCLKAFLGTLQGRLTILLHEMNARELG
eukprot:1363817-Amphidinium_carterae.2